MERMSKIDYFDLDGAALRLFLAVLEEGSVTGAAIRLGLTQSAVSHSLSKLRRIAQDPLFAKSGRGIVATAHARALAARARALLDDMKGFASGASFDPRAAELTMTVAANDFQRDLLLPTLFGRIEAAVKRVTLRVIPSQLPTAALLRENRCDLLISPLPPTGEDIMQKRLLQDRYVCFYDPRRRAPPASRADYLAARHVTVVYPDNERLNFDRRLAAVGVERDIAVSAPSFSGVPAFLRDSLMLASMPSLLSRRLTDGLAFAPIPLGRRQNRLVDLPMYMAWHRRFQDDPAHVWLRRLLNETAAEVTRSHAP